MSVATFTSIGATAWTTRGLRWAVALHVVVVAIPVTFAISGSRGVAGSDAGPGVLAVPAGLALLALQLRHSLATMDGERPRGAGWTLPALAVLAYAPVLWFGWSWALAQGLVIASALMVLRGWTAAAVAVVTILVTDVAMAEAVTSEGLPVGVLAYEVFYTTLALVLAPATLYGSARLQLARNLHDLLGQSLSAISLKGDLALRLLRGDRPAARAEIQSLAGVARGALHDMQALTRDQHTVTLAAEIDGAASLLAAAGVHLRLDVDLPELPAAAEEVLAWAVKEGATNILRHSQASTCAIAARRRRGRVQLEIVNDGAGTPVGEGSGLAGLAARAHAVDGTASAGPAGDGRFRLLVELPQAYP